MLKVRPPCTYVLLPVFRNGDGLLCLDYENVRIARSMAGMSIPRPTEVYAGTEMVVVYWVTTMPGRFGVENVYNLDGSLAVRPWAEVWSVARDVDETFLSRCAFSGILRGEVERSPIVQQSAEVSRG